MDTQFWIVFTSIVGASLLGNFLLGWYRARNSTYSEYAADPNQYGTFMIAATLAGTIVGGGMFMAATQMGYEAGVVGYVVGIVYLLGLILMGVLVKRIRSTMDELGAETLIDCIKLAYSVRVARVFSFVSGFIYLFLLAGQFLALGLVSKYLIEALGQPIIIWTLTGCAFLTATVYPIFGGLRKDIQTDAMQMLLIILGSAPIVYLLFNSVSSVSFDKLPPEMFTGRAYGIVFLIGLIVFYTPSFLVRMDFWQRVRAAKTEKSAFLGLFIAGIVSLLFFSLFTTLGIWARAKGLSSAEFAVFDILFQQLPVSWALALVLGAFYAAVLSTADTLLNNISLFLSQLVAPNRGANKNDLEKLSSARMWAFLSTLISLFLAWSVADIVNLFVAALALLLIFLPLMIGLLIRANRSEPAAYYSTIASFILFWPLFIFWDKKTAFAPAVLLAILLYYLINWKLSRIKKNNLNA